MVYEVEFTDEFEEWFDSLTAIEQDSIRRSVNLLEEIGPALTRPHADTIHGSNVPNMRELRCQHQGVLTACCMPSIRGAPPCC